MVAVCSSNMQACMQIPKIFGKDKLKHFMHEFSKSDTSFGINLFEI